MVTICSGRDHGRPQSKIDEAHSLHFIPSDLWPLLASQLEGIFSHCDDHLTSCDY